MFNVGTAPDGSLREQTRILTRYAQPASAAFWVWPGAAIYFDLSREPVFGCGDLSTALAFDEPRSARSSQRGTMRAQGPLLELLQSPEFTLLIETENFANTDLGFDIVTAGAVRSSRAPRTAPCGQPRIAACER
jgi:hypothetical protein